MWEMTILHDILEPGTKFINIWDCCKIPGNMALLFLQFKSLMPLISGERKMCWDKQFNTESGVFTYNLLASPYDHDFLISWLHWIMSICFLSAVLFWYLFLWLFFFASWVVLASRNYKFYLIILFCKSYAV